MTTAENMNIMTHIIMTAFGNQMRTSTKGGPGIPAWTHSVRVMLTLQSYGYGESVFLAGGAHDLLEDTKFPLDTIRNQFGQRVAFLVDSCTIKSELGDTPEGEDELWRRVLNMAEQGDYDPLRIKVMDVLDNIRNIHNVDAPWVGNSLAMGFLWYGIALHFIPQEPMVEDLRTTLLQEQAAMFKA